MDFLQQGLNDIEKMKQRGFAEDDDTKYLQIDKEGSAEFIILDPSIDQIVRYYRHKYFHPSHRDKIGMSLKCTCRSMAEDEDPKNCEICNEMIFVPKNIKREPVSGWSGIDMRTVTMEGSTWGHTVKMWTPGKILSKTTRDNIIKMYNGKTLGLRVNISRSGTNAPREGNSCQLMGHVDLRWFLHNSPRIKWYQDRVLKLSEGKRRLTPEEAFAEYFRPYNYREVLAPTPKRVDTFLAYVRRVEGAGQQSKQVPESKTSFSFGANIPTLDFNAAPPSSVPSSPSMPQNAPLSAPPLHSGFPTGATSYNPGTPTTPSPQTKGQGGWQAPSGNPSDYDPSKLG